VVGGGDSAIEAAMGLGHQVGNEVTLSYRKEGFSRIKERNAQRIQESIRKGKVKVVFNSNPVEFKKDSVVIDVNGKLEEIPNDYVWIFAGGEPPTAFLKKNWHWLWRAGPHRYGQHRSKGSPATRGRVEIGNPRN